jgi:hypothetical protein
MFTVGRARSQTRARRGAGVLEYNVAVTPAPDRRVRDLYNASRSSGWPRLTAKGFLVLCGPEAVEERLALINAEALPCLEVLAEEVAAV